MTLYHDDGAVRDGAPAPRPAPWERPRTCPARQPTTASFSQSSRRSTWQLLSFITTTAAITFSHPVILSRPSHLYTLYLVSTVTSDQLASIKRCSKFPVPTSCPSILRSSAVTSAPPGSGVHHAVSGIAICFHVSCSTLTCISICSG